MLTKNPKMNDHALKVSYSIMILFANFVDASDEYFMRRQSVKIIDGTRQGEIRLNSLYYAYGQ